VQITERLKKLVTKFGHGIEDSIQEVASHRRDDYYNDPHKLDHRLR
jgi:hypothetical protein